MSVSLLPDVTGASSSSAQRGAAQTSTSLGPSFVQLSHALRIDIVDIVDIVDNLDNIESIGEHT